MSANLTQDPAPYNRLVIYRRDLAEALRMAATLAESSPLSIKTMTVNRDDCGFWVVELFIATLRSVSMSRSLRLTRRAGSWWRA